MPYEYTVLGTKISLEVDPTVVAVRFKGAQPNSIRAHSIEAAGAGPFTQRIDIPGEDLAIIPSGVTVARGEILSPQATIAALNAQPAITHALPVFRVSGNQVVASARIIVGLDDQNKEAALAEKYSLSPIKGFDSKVLFQIPEGGDPFDICAKVTREVGVRFAEPDFITIGRHLPKRSDSGFSSRIVGPAVPRQYAMSITHATEAWDVQSGDKRIRIAVLDEGTDTRHPDLKRAVVGTFDATDGDTYQEPNLWDGHGTACAGLAAAAGATVTGIRGSGSGCSLLAVRIALSNFDGGPWVTTNEKIATGISWSWKNGAAILSNSWGGGAPSNAIAEEFENARTKGRGGLGCIVIVAAGNTFDAVKFPADLPNVLCVAASNEFDEAKTPTSRDGENWWGTCHGPQVSVAAPGVHNLTTDIFGAGGYSAGEYYDRFNGTSSATPIVAGACGLALSANNNIIESAVREAVKATAEKVGQFNYDASGRNDYFGFGRLNVLKLVQMAKSTHGVA